MKKLFLQKLFLSFLFLLSGSLVGAENLSGVHVGLFDHVGPAIQFANGRTNIAIVDSAVQFGVNKGDSLFDIQPGVMWDVDPECHRGKYGKGYCDSGKAHFILGGFLKLSTWVRDAYPTPRWAEAFEYGLKFDYDFRERHSYGSFQLGLVFGLSQATPVEDDDLAERRHDRRSERRLREERSWTNE